MAGSKEIGRVGQRRYGGTFYEEFLHELRGRRGIETYREMSENDDVVGAILFAIEMLVRQCDWKTRWEQHIREETKLKAVYHFIADFWRVRCLDGEWLLNGEYLLDAIRYKARAALRLRSEVDMSELETVENLTVETKSRDYWFLDGAYALDGSRNLNSIYRKEAVE